MTWLDHVLAMPTVGCGVVPSFHTAQELISALRPQLKEWGKTTELGITSEQPLLLTIARKDGFTYSFEPDKFAVQFRYRYELKQKPGQAIPELSPGLEFQKFSVLLGKAIDDYCAIFDQVVGSESRAVVRMGIVATCRLDKELLPPGVERFVRYLTQPWGKPLTKCQTHLVGVLSKDEKIQDRCHHQLDMTDDRPNDVHFTLGSDCFRRHYKLSKERYRGTISRNVPLRL
jgi:hypothetical protein